MGEGGGNRAGFVAALLLGAVMAGAVGGGGLRWIQDQGVADDPAVPPPVIILSVAELLRSGKDALEIRALADQLAAGGFLVLDAQSVLAAPPSLYLQPGHGTVR